jgi:hypothetical protein
MQLRSGYHLIRDVIILAVNGVKIGWAIFYLFLFFKVLGIILKGIYLPQVLVIP